MSTSDYTNEPLPASKKKANPMSTSIWKVPSGVTCSQDIPLLDRAGYHAHIARLDITTPAYQAAFGFWPCNRKQGDYSTSVEVTKAWRHDALYPHFTVNLYYHSASGVRKPKHFGSCHIYLDSSISFALYDRIDDVTKRTKYFYKTYNGTIHSWIVPDVHKVVSTWPSAVPRPPGTWVKPDYVHAELKDDEPLHLLQAHTTFSEDYLSLDPATCTHLATTDLGAPQNPNKLPPKTPQDAARRALNMYEAGAVYSNSEILLKAAEDQKAQIFLKSNEEQEADDSFEDLMAEMSRSAEPPLPSTQAQAHLTPVTGGPSMSPAMPLPGATPGSFLPGVTIGPALPPGFRVQDREGFLLSSLAPLSEQGEKRKRDEEDVGETDAPLQTRAKFDKEEDGHVG